MSKGKNVIVSDTVPGPEWNFDSILTELTGEKWSLYHGGLKYKLLKRSERIKRYINFVFFPLKIFFHRRGIKNLIAWQQYYGLIYALYCMIFRVKKTNYCMVMTFIYNKRNGIFGRMHYHLVRKIINSRYLDCIIVYSEYEKKYYEKLFSVLPGKIKHCHLGLEDLSKKVEPADDGFFILSAGRSNRDYNFLFNALLDKKFEVRIVCDNLERESKHNIHVYKKTYYEDFFQMVANCFCIVIALQDEKISSGQLVILQAKQFGKPVIVTESRAVAEYIEDGVDGYIISKDKETLMNRLEALINDDSLYERMCKASRKSYEDKFSLYSLGVQIVKCLETTGRNNNERI